MDGCYARLEWDAADDQSGPVMYHIYRDTKSGPEFGEMISSTWFLADTDNICGSGRRYYYTVRATDSVGNQEANTVEINAKFTGQLFPYISNKSEAE